MPPTDPTARRDGAGPDDQDLVRRASDGAVEVADAAASVDMDALWSRIADEAFGAGDDEAAADDDAAAPATSPPAPTQRHMASAPTPHAARGRPRRAPAWLGLAAGLILVVGAATVFLQARDEAPVATYAMEALDERAAGPATGTIVQRDGETVVELDLSVLPERADSAAYELWVLDLDAGEIVSLGQVEPDTDAVVVPETIAVAEFPTLDVSVEPDDGVPTHSGDSVLRGPITVTG